MRICFQKKAKNQFPSFLYVILITITSARSFIKAKNCFRFIYRGTTPFMRSESQSIGKDRWIAWILKNTNQIFLNSVISDKLKWTYSVPYQDLLTFILEEDFSSFNKLKDSTQLKNQIEFFLVPPTCHHLYLFMGLGLNFYFIPSSLMPFYYYIRSFPASQATGYFNWNIGPPSTPPHISQKKE